MAQIKKINIKGVEYDIAGSGTGGGITAIDKVADYNSETGESSITFTEDELNLLYSNTGIVVNIFDSTTAEGPLMSVSPSKPPFSSLDGEGTQALLSLYGRAYNEGIEWWFRLDQSSDDPLKFIVALNFCAPFESICYLNMPKGVAGDAEYVLIEDPLLNFCASTFYQQPFQTICINKSNADASESENPYFSLTMQAMLADTHIMMYTNKDTRMACVIMATIEDGPEAIGVLVHYGEDWSFATNKENELSSITYYNTELLGSETEATYIMPTYPTNDYSFTLPNDSTFLSVQGTSGCTATTNASSTPLAINSAVSTYFGYPQLLVRNFSPLTTHTTPAAAAPTFMLAETGAGTNTGKQLELFYSPTWATENPARFTNTTTANLFHANSMANQEWYSLGTITIREGQWQGKKSLAGLSFNTNLTDDFNISSTTSGAVSINHIISLDLPMAGNRCIWQGMSPEFEVYQGLTAIDNVSMSSIPSGKLYKRNYVGNAYSWIASSSATTLNNPVCFKLMHAFGPEAGLESSSNNSKYYNYQYESTGSARLQNDWTRVTCNVDEGTIDIANTTVISVTQINIQLQY